MWAWPRSRDPTIFGIRSNISSKLLKLDTSILIHCFVWAMPSRSTNNFHESGRGYNVTAIIFGSTVGYPSDSLASCSCHLPQLPVQSLTVMLTKLMIETIAFLPRDALWWPTVWSRLRLRDRYRNNEELAFNVYSIVTQNNKPKWPAHAHVM